MNVHDERNRRLLVEVVVQIEAETDAHVDPEDGQPDERGPAIVTRRPGCGGVYAQTMCPLVAGNENEMTRVDASLSCAGREPSGLLSVRPTFPIRLPNVGHILHPSALR